VARLGVVADVCPVPNNHKLSFSVHMTKKNAVQGECRVYTERDFLMWKTWMWVQGILTGAGVVVVGILTGAW